MKNSVGEKSLTLFFYNILREYEFSCVLLAFVLYLLFIQDGIIEL